MGWRAQRVRNTYVVLIDLSDAEPQSVVVFIRMSKDAIRDKDVLADEQLAPLRAALVSSLVRANAAIRSSKAPTPSQSRFQLGVFCESQPRHMQDAIGDDVQRRLHK